MRRLCFSRKRSNAVVLGQPDAVAVDEHAHDVAHRGRPRRCVSNSRVDRRLAAAEHQHVDAAVLARETLVDIGEHALDGHDARAARRRLGEAGRTGEIAGGRDVLEEDAGVLGLHFAEAAQVDRGHRIPVAGHVGRVALGRRGPLLEVGEDLRHLVVERRHAPVDGTAALEPDAAVALGEESGEARHLVERTMRLVVMAVRAEGRDVPVNTVAAQRHARHIRTLF